MANALQIVDQVGVRNHHALRIARGSGRVLQEREVAAADHRRLEMVGQLVRQFVGRDPLARGRVGRQQLRIECCQRRSGRERHVRVAIERDPVESWHRAPRLRIRRRHGNHARIQAAEKRRNEIEPRRIHEQRPIARLQFELQPRRDYASPPIELAVRHFDGAIPIVEKDVSNARRIVRRLLGQDVRHRVSCEFTTHRRASPSIASSGGIRSASRRAALSPESLWRNSSPCGSTPRRTRHSYEFKTACYQACSTRRKSAATRLWTDQGAARWIPPANTVV
jgi:hypothetical protein